MDRILLERAEEAIAEGGGAGGFGGHFAGADSGGLAEADDGGDVERAGAETGFMAAAFNLRGQAHPGAADVERAGALGAVDFVGAERHQGNAVGGDIERELAESLNGVAVERHVFLTADGADFTDGLDDADFVIGVHDADEAGFGADGGAELVEINEAVRAGLEDGDGGGVLEGIEHGGVLGGHADDVAGGDALEGEVVGFGGAAGEDDVAGSGAGERGDAAAGLLDGLFGLPAEAVACGWRHYRISRRTRAAWHRARADRRGWWRDCPNRPEGACLDVPIVA